MGDRVLEIVVFLMSKIKDQQGRLDDLEEIATYLKGQGFTENEISSAYSWFLDHLQNDNEFLYNSTINANATRILSAQERQLFSSEAVGYLLQLRHLGLLNDQQFEMVLERGSMIWTSSINLDQVKMLIETILFSESRAIESVGEIPHLITDEAETVN
ncbi:MAG: DUF494 domain-containing protein [candidate division Zixibacteria bacterium]|nr:DUF494 domain-containing protein [candidate division Zixibacteria bacterium]